MGWTTGVRFLAEAGFFSSPPRTDRVWGSPSPLSNGYGGSFAGIKQPGCEVDPHPHLVPWLWMRGAIPPLPQ